MKVSELAVAYLDFAGVAEETRRYLLERWLPMLRQHAGDPDVAAFFSVEAYRAFCVWARDSGRWKASTVNRRISWGKTLWRFAHSRGLTTCPVDDRPIKRLAEETLKPTSWTEDEMRRIIAAVSLIWNRKVWGHRRWRALIRVYYYTGWRADSVMSLRRKHLCVDRLYLPAAFEKTRTDDYKRLPEDLCADLEILAPLPDDLFFPYRRHDSLCAGLRKIILRAGLEATSRDMFHKLRRSHATHLVIATGSMEVASRSLNHKSTMTTRKYVDVSLLPNMQPVDVLPSL